MPLSAAERVKHGNVRHVVRRAVARGDLHVGTCRECGTSTDLHAHHEDYDQPLEVVWLCARHHRKLHIGRRGDVYRTPGLRAALGHKQAVAVYLSREERDRLVRASASQSLAFSTWLRMVGLRAAEHAEAAEGAGR